MLSRKVKGGGAWQLTPSNRVTSDKYTEDEELF